MGVTQRKGVKAGDGKKTPSAKLKKVVTPAKNAPAAKARAPRKPPPNTFVPEPADSQIVLFSAALGFTHEQIAKQVRMADGGISTQTLKKYFAEELATGLDRATLAVARNLYGMANSATHKSAAICAMFWLKTRAGWIDKPERIAVAEVEGAQNIAGLPPPENGKIVIRLKMDG